MNLFAYDFEQKLVVGGGEVGAGLELALVELFAGAKVLADVLHQVDVDLGRDAVVRRRQRPRVQLQAQVLFTNAKKNMHTYKL
mgnify:CR=1 FL=1